MFRKGTPQQYAISVTLMISLLGTGQLDQETEAHRSLSNRTGVSVCFHSQISDTRRVVLKHGAQISIVYELNVANQQRKTWYALDSRSVGRPIAKNGIM